MTTVLDAVCESLSAPAGRKESRAVAPVATLWPDPESAWRGVINQLRERLDILTVGRRDEESDAGPAIWIRAQLASLSGQATPPIIYLPGVTRRDLAGGTPQSDALAPLLETVHRCTWWLGPRERPWAPGGFLKHPDGAGLSLADDPATDDAVLAALPFLLARDINELRQHGTLDARRLTDLRLPDPDRQVLRWLNDGDRYRDAITDVEWAALCDSARTHFDIDPNLATVITAAGRLGRRQGRWAGAWQRFVEAPQLYPRVPDRLADAAPVQLLAVADKHDPHPDSWPGVADRAEDELRCELRTLAERPSSLARPAVLRLESEHGDARGSVWAQLGRRPLAQALEHLAEAARLTDLAPSYPDVTAWSTWYAETGHRVDDAVLRAVAATRPPRERTIMTGALRAIIEPWWTEVVERFQQAAQVSYSGQRGLPIEDGTVVLFVDGLRYDLAVRLRDRMSSGPCVVQLGHRLAAFPTVTRSGQPAVAPIMARLAGGPTGFTVVDDGGREVHGTRLEALLRGSGVTRLREETGDPDGRAWTIHTNIDSIGHREGVGLADRVEAELETLAARVGSLLEAGWRQVTIVTDHGFLLAPWGLPKTHLPLHLTQGEDTRGGRAARLSDAAGDTGLPSVPWTWDPSVTMVSPRGISAFTQGKIYDHGGLSPQECVIPVLSVTASHVVRSATIDGIRWTRAWCRIDVSPADFSAEAAVRLQPGDPGTTVAGPKPVTDGEVKVLVEDDTLEGVDAFVVLLAADGRVVAQSATRIGAP